MAATPQNSSPKYYTFASAGAAKKAGGKPGDAISIGAGESLAYSPGLGYYAKKAAPALPNLPVVGTPPGAVINPPPNGSYVPAPGVGTGGGSGVTTTSPFAADSPAALSTQAGQLAQSQLDPQEAEARRQQALAAAAATADEGAISGFQTAAGGIMAGIAPDVGAGYQAAAATEGAVGTGVAGQVGADLAQKTSADQAFEASQGQTGAPTVNPTQAQETLGYLNGQIPADSMAQQGAAQQALAAKQAELPLDAGREQLDARMAQARQDQDTYAQQLISLAQQFPGLKATALQQLNQYEIDKAQERDAHATSVANIVAQKAQTAIQARAETANEKSAGLTQSNKDEQFAIDYAGLQFKTSQAAAKAAANGKIIDVGASKLLGHVVYKDGSSDTSIKVKQTTATTTTQKAVVNRDKATSKARVDGFNYAIKLKGKPVVNKEQGPIGGPGKYVADPSQKYGVAGGVFPPVGKNGVATTNDPSRAATTGGLASNYADAQSKVWGEIDGDGLMARYGYSKQQVLAMVNTALARAGWKK